MSDIVQNPSPFSWKQKKCRYLPPQPHLGRRQEVAHGTCLRVTYKQQEQICEHRRECFHLGAPLGCLVQPGKVWELSRQVEPSHRASLRVHRAALFP